MKTAGIIGGMDFIGCYITLKFLSEDYRVKVPVSNSPEKGSLLNMQSLLANENLEICKNNMEDIHRLKEFMQGCNIIVQCGNPVKLSERENGTPLYIPQIKGTAQLLKAAKQATSVEKIIFITSPAVYSMPRQVSSPTGNKPGKNEAAKNARFHADQTLQGLLDGFPDYFFEVILLAPVEMKDNMLVSNSNSISAGLQFLFRNNTDQDPLLQKLFKRNLMQTMIDIQQLPEKVYKTACQKNQVE